MNDHRPLRVRYRAAWSTGWCVSRKCAEQIPLPPYTCPTNQRAEETLTFLKPRPQFWMLSRTRTPPDHAGFWVWGSRASISTRVAMSADYMRLIFIFLVPYKFNVSIAKCWPNVQIILPYFRFADAWFSLYHKVWLIIQCFCIFFTDEMYLYRISFISNIDILLNNSTKFIEETVLLHFTASFSFL